MDNILVKFIKVIFEVIYYLLRLITFPFMKLRDPSYKLSKDNLYSSGINLNNRIIIINSDIKLEEDISNNLVNNIVNNVKHNKYKWDRNYDENLIYAYNNIKKSYIISNNNNPINIYLNTNKDEFIMDKLNMDKLNIINSFKEKDNNYIIIANTKPFNNNDYTEYENESNNYVIKIKNIINLLKGNDKYKNVQLNLEKILHISKIKFNHIIKNDKIKQIFENYINKILTLEFILLMKQNQILLNINEKNINKIASIPIDSFIFYIYKIINLIKDLLNFNEEEYDNEKIDTLFDNENNFLLNGNQLYQRNIESID